MPNVINPYDPIWYAQTALAILEKSLGMAGRVYRGYDKSPQQPGSVIQIRKPSTFVATDAPATATDLTPTSVSVTLNKWREVKFALTDKELNFAGERIIEDHIRPAAVALADDIDLNLVGLWKDIPYYNDITLSSVGVSNLTDARKTLFNNRVPLDDLHFMIDGNLEAGFLGLTAFSQQQGAGDQGVSTQQRGTLGQKFGFEVFSNQNVPSATSATVADLVGAINNGAGYAIGTSTISLKSLSISAALKAGDILVITGDTQQYVLTADFTADGSGIIAAATIAPPLAAAVVDSQVVTVVLSGGSGTTKTQNLAFHRNAFCLAMAPLSTLGNQLGARIESVVDPITGLALRSRMFYDGNNSKVVVALDVLYGVKTLNQNMAVRGRAA